MPSEQKMGSAISLLKLIISILRIHDVNLREKPKKTTARGKAVVAGGRGEEASGDDQPPCIAA
jgi:hypothetical protein